MNAGRSIGGRPLIWLGFAVLLVLDVPWWLPSGAEGSLYGVPIWALVCFGVNLLLGAYTAWVIARFWNPEEGAPLEEDAERG